MPALNSQSASSRSAMQPISASLPSLFRTLPATSNRSRQSVERNTRSMLVSTECQTDDSVLQNVVANNNNNNTTSGSSRPVSHYTETDVGENNSRRRRRREKRRRRRSQPASTQQTELNNTENRRYQSVGVAVQPLQHHLQQQLQQQTQLTVTSVDDHQVGPVSPSSDHLPDILNSHLPPPYSTLPHNTERCMGMGPMAIAPAALNLNVGLGLGLGGLLTPLVTATAQAPGPAAAIGINSPASATTTNGSFVLPQAAGRRSRGSAYAGEESSKSCCGVMVNQTVSIRWFIIMIAFVGICCAVVGTVLGAMRASGREHLTVSLLMIGVGIVLITVSGIAWRLTSQDAPSCRAMLGLSPPLSSSSPVEAGDCAAEAGRRFLSRIPPPYGRPQHPYAAMMYPEFQYRPPPPSYQASMQEYRLRLLLMDRERQQQQQQQARQASNASRIMPPGPPASPPPTYRSNTSTLRPPLPNRNNEFSRPPSYRSRSSASTAGSTHSILRSTGTDGITNVPNGHSRSLSSSDTPASGPNQTTDELKLLTETVVIHQDPTLSSKREKDNNRVTIVQTTSSSQVLSNENSPVLVTVTSAEESLSASAQNLHVLAQL